MGTPQADAASIVAQLTPAFEAIETSPGSNVILVTNTLANPTGSVASQINLTLDDGFTLKWQANVTADLNSSLLNIICAGGSTSTVMISNCTLKNGHDNGTGLIIGQGVSLIVQSGLIESRGPFPTVSADSAQSVTISGGIVRNTGAGIAVDAHTVTVLNADAGIPTLVSAVSRNAIRANYPGAQVNISGGTVTAAGNGAVIGSNITVYGGVDSIINISGGTIQNIDKGSAILGHTITISESNATVPTFISVENGGAISAYDDGSITIHGGTITSEGGTVVATNGRVDMDGGLVYQLRSSATVIFARNGGTFTGGLVYGSGSHNITHGLHPTGNAIYIMRTKYQEAAFTNGASTGLSCMPAAVSAVWTISGGAHGIAYTNGNISGFLAVPDIEVVPYALADMWKNSIMLFSEDALSAGEVIHFSAWGDRQNAEGTLAGDTRYTYAAWRVQSGDDILASGNTYDPVVIDSPGQYMLYITFRLERWDGFNWQDTGQRAYSQQYLSLGPDTRIRITGVALDAETLALETGESVQLTAAVSPANASDKTVNWSSSDKTAATVSSTGLVTAVAAGTTTITVSTQDGNFTASCAITVLTNDSPTNPNVPAPITPSITKVKLAQGSIRLAKGQKATIGAVVYMSDDSTTGDGLVWSSSNIKVASVNQSGKISAKAVTRDRTATITATAENGMSAKIKVTVLKTGAAAVETTKVAISGGRTVEVGKTARLKAKISPNNATKATITWKSDKSSVISVDKAGRITAHKQGTARITLKAGGKTATVTITAAAPVQSVKIITATKSVKVKRTLKLTADVTMNVDAYAGATPKLTWSSSNTAVATVSKWDGKVAAKAPGKAIITVKAANGKSAKVTITVKK